jgi:Tfp pilus assembly protein PilF
MRMNTGALTLLAATWLTIAAGNVVARPYVPADDGIVLERLPERTDPALAELKRMRLALAAQPDDLENATRVARRSIEAARATGDPRFLGQAQAALAPWWVAPDPPTSALLLRATLKQSQHDFPGALADLDRLLARRPNDGQALLTRATVLTVQGRYADARRDCSRLSRLTSALVATACSASVASLNGAAGEAYEALIREVASKGEAAGVREWALTLAAEICARRGSNEAADRHFRAAFALDPGDAYLKGAYADFLLEQGRAREVIALLRTETSNDSLLLRLALAEQALPDQRAAFEGHRGDLRDRFAAARMRRDTVHLREEARFELEIMHDSEKALALAQQDWQVQKEPADLRVLAAAARAAGDATARSTVAEWFATTRLEDVVAQAAAERTSP